MNLESINVSVVANATTKPCTTVSLHEVLTKIRDGECATRIAQIRAAPSKEVANALKRLLPAVLFCGVFTTRNKDGLVSRSGLIVVDWDGVPDPAALIARLAQDACCVAAFASPSGTGAKGLFHVDKTREHKDSWKAVRAHCKSREYPELDPSGSDVSRMCYFSHDPSMYIASGEVACVEYLAAEIAPVAPVASSGILTPGEAYNASGDVAALLRKFAWTSDDDTNWTRPGKDISAGPSASLGVVEGPPRSLWVFSTNAPPFTPNKRYEPWHVFAMLECGGDFALATAELMKLGFGAPADGLDGDPAFLILPSACGLSISESAAKIFATIGEKRTLFSRGRVPHEVVNDGHGGKLEPMTSRAFRSRLEKHGKLMAWRADRDGKRKLSPAICAEETASALLVTTEARDLLPRIRAIVSAPALAMDCGNLVVMTPGWNPQGGGVFVTGGKTPPTIPVSEAVDSLLSLLDDFIFQTGGDHSRAIASLITPALKPAALINGSTPIEVCEADKSQSGKGYLRKLVSVLYGETPTFVTQKEGGVGSLDESVGSALISGRPFIQLDNVRGKVASAYLEAILTADGPVPCREPHKPTIEVDIRPFTFSLTSNGVEATRDLANRCSIVRIQKRPPGFLFQTFPEGGLLDNVRVHQAYYLGCVFAVVREWVAQGRQHTSESRHDFRAWAQALDWIVREIFGTAPLMEGHNDARDRVSDQGRSWLRAVALKLAEENRLDHEFTASALAELSSENDIPVPNGRADVADEYRARLIGKAMAKLFAEGGGGVRVDDFVVIRSMKYSPNAAKEIPHYRFTRG